MKCVSVRELRSRSAAVWRSLAREKDLVVTAKGKPIAVLSATTTSTLKASLAALRQARAQLAVGAMQRRARETGADRLTLEDVNAEIDAVRRSREGRESISHPGVAPTSGWCRAGVHRISGPWRRRRTTRSGGSE